MMQASSSKVHAWFWLPTGALLGLVATGARTAVQFPSEYFGFSDLMYLRGLWLAPGFIGGTCVGALAWVLGRRVAVLRDQWSDW